jgi:hypothetical protein
MATKKKSSKKPKTKAKPDEDVSSKLYEWIAEGYNVDKLVQAVKSKDDKEIKQLFKEFKTNIVKIEEIRKNLETLKRIRAINTKNPLYVEILEALKDPTKVEIAEKFLASLKSGPKLKELQVELASLNVTGFEAEARAIKAKFKNPELTNEIEKDIKSLRRRIKEKFFEEEFEDVVVPSEERPKKFVAETIFLLHRDGTLLAVKSKKPPTEIDKKLLSRMVMAIREQMSKAFNEGEHIHTLKYEGHSIILEDSSHVYAAVVVTGEAQAIMYRIILKALQIMEKKLNKEFENWTGDRSSIENLDKYTTAIFQALDKVG